MKAMLMFVSAADGSDMQGPEAAAIYQAIGTWWADHQHAGTIVGGEQLAPAATARTVHISAAGSRVVDGPFIESKEAVGGYALVEVADLDAAIELARTWPAGGTVEVRSVVAM